MDELFDRLCQILDEELERQENVRDLCLAQREAVRARNLEEVDAKSAALQVLIRDAVQHEAARHSVLQSLVTFLGLPKERQTLSELISVAPAPWNSRLEHYQQRLQATMQETRPIVRETSLLVRRSLRVVSQCMQVVNQAVPGKTQPYTDRGSESAVQGRSAILINQRG